MKPTKGRVVLVKWTRPEGAPEQPGWEEENVAMVTRVEDGALVLGAQVAQRPASTPPWAMLVAVLVPLEEGKPSPEGFSWRWPPREEGKPQVRVEPCLGAAPEAVHLNGMEYVRVAEALAASLKRDAALESAGMTWPPRGLGDMDPKAETVLRLQAMRRRGEVDEGTMRGLLGRPSMELTMGMVDCIVKAATPPPAQPEGPSPEEVARAEADWEASTPEEKALAAGLYECLIRRNGRRSAVSWAQLPVLEDCRPLVRADWLDVARLVVHLAGAGPEALRDMPSLEALLEVHAAPVAR